jgi:hypothetical protein
MSGLDLLYAAAKEGYSMFGQPMTIKPEAVVTLKNWIENLDPVYTVVGVDFGHYYGDPRCYVRLNGPTGHKSLVIEWDIHHKIIKVE